MSSPNLIIFDCDGVLVDSEPISISVLLDVMAKAGHVMEEGTAYKLFLGRSMATTIELLREDFGFVVTPAHLDQARATLNERFRRELKPIPGIKAALDKLSGPRCIASSSKPERIRLSLSITGLLDQFEPHIYSATMVKRGKPAPDLFLHAARDMGMEPDDCLVIEDSPAGVEAAKAAGMRVFGFTGGSHALAGGLAAALALLEPDAVFDDMRLLPSLVAAPGTGR
ncbi:MAG: HAD family hydrolase [Hyphomicrobiales bacterium]|nr:HAD family hydrolase [Hyphomicrobiales bacterium]